MLVVTVLGLLTEVLLMSPLLFKFDDSLVEVLDALFELILLEDNLPLLPLTIQNFVLLFVKASRQEEVECVVVDLDAEVYFHVLLIQRFHLLLEAQVEGFARGEPSEGEFKHLLLFFGVSHQIAELAAIRGTLVQPCSFNMAVNAFPVLNRAVCIIKRLMADL